MTRHRPALTALLVVLEVAAGTPYLLASLITSGHDLLVMRLTWVGSAGVAWAVHRRSPALALAVPGATVLLGVAALVLGGRYLGWEG